MPYIYLHNCKHVTEQSDWSIKIPIQITKTWQVWPDVLLPYLYVRMYGVGMAGSQDYVFMQAYNILTYVHMLCMYVCVCMCACACMHVCVHWRVACMYQPLLVIKVYIPCYIIVVFRNGYIVCPPYRVVTTWGDWIWVRSSFEPDISPKGEWRGFKVRSWIVGWVIFIVTQQHKCVY